MIKKINMGSNSGNIALGGILTECNEFSNNLMKKGKKSLAEKIFDQSIEKIKKNKNPYGDGNSSKRIVKVLSDIKIDKKLLQKRITY